MAPAARPLAGGFLAARVQGTRAPLQPRGGPLQPAEHPPRQRGPIPKLYVLPTPAAQQPAPVAQQPSPPQPVLPPQKGSWALQPEGGSGAAVALTGDVMWVGRWKERCDIWLDDGGKPSKGSRMHARLEYDAKADAWTLVDNDSANGSHVNGLRVLSAVLAEGDRVGFGSSAADDSRCPHFLFTVRQGTAQQGTAAAAAPPTAAAAAAPPTAAAAAPTAAAAAPATACHARGRRGHQ